MMGDFRARHSVSYKLFAGVLASLSLCPLAVRAHPFTPIESNDSSDPGLLQSIQFFAPVGQEIVALVPCLDAVELFTEDFDVIASGGATLVARIHQGTIVDPPIATSTVVTLPNGFAGVTHFDFPDSPLLIPGLLYVIEVSVLSGDNWAVGSFVSRNCPGLLCQQGDTYPVGRQVLMGVPQQDNDLWFRLGVSDLPSCVLDAAGA